MRTFLRGRLQGRQRRQDLPGTGLEGGATTARRWWSAGRRRRHGGTPATSHLHGVRWDDDNGLMHGVGRCSGKGDVRPEVGVGCFPLSFWVVLARLGCMLRQLSCLSLGGGRGRRSEVHSECNAPVQLAD